MTIEPRTDKTGKVVSFRLRCCVGRDSQRKQIWRTCTIPRPEGLTPAKERKEVERLAAQWEAEQKAEYERTHSREDRSKLTLATFIQDKWWTQHVMDGSHKSTSIQFYRNLSNSIIEYKPIADKQLAKITAADIKGFIIYLQTRAVTKDGKPLSATTVKRTYETLRNVLNFALRFGYISSDPCQSLSVKDKPRKESHEIDYLKPKDINRFMAALEQEPLFWRTMETVLLVCGLRRGEIVALRWGDVDSDKHELNISRNITVDPSSPKKYAVGSPKSGHGRTVPLPKNLYDMLLALRKEQEEKYGMIFAPSAYVFCRDEDPSEPLYPSTPSLWHSRFIKRHDLPNLSVHDMRHSCATLMLESGSSVKEVQEILGHSSPQTTLSFYSAATEEAQRRSVERLEEMLNVKSAEA